MSHPIVGLVRLGLFAIGWNGILAVAVNVLYLRPWRRRRLVMTGIAVAGEVTGRYVPFNRKSAVGITYHYCPPTGPIAGRQGLTVAQSTQARVGQPVTVLYDPARPASSIVYEFSGHTVGPGLLQRLRSAHHRP